MKKLMAIAVLGMCLSCAEVHAQVRVKAATEAAEWLLARFGAKAGRSVPELAGRIERIAAKHGDDAIIAIRKGGPTACELIETAGADAAKAVRVLATHGEQGASRILSRPVAMKQFLQYGDDAATALVKHPGVAEPLVERGGAQAVKALGAVDAQNGRRLAMLLDGELAQAGRHPELFKVVASHGDRAMNFIWQNRNTLAAGAGLAAFLADPEPFLNGARDLAAVAGETVVKPVVGGAVSAFESLLIGIVAVVVVLGLLVHKFGPPSLETCLSVFSLFKK